MRILIQNYASPLSTEPMYFTRCLSSANKEVSLWSDPNTSAFDAFDSIKPDVFISHFKFLTNDIIKYLSSNKNISLALNVSYATDEEMKNIEIVLENNKINTQFLFSNQYGILNGVSPSKNKLVNIIPALDVFIGASAVPSFNIDSAIISTGENEDFKRECKSRDVYHKLCLGGESDTFDIPVNIQSVSSLFDSYDEIVIADDINIATSQIMFEASFKAKKLKIQVPNEQKELLDKIFLTLFSDDSETEDVSKLVKQQILKKHNCFKRTARLARALKDSQLAQELEKVSDKL